MPPSQQLVGNFVEKLNQTIDKSQSMTVAIKTSKWDEKSPTNKRPICQNLIHNLTKSWKQLDVKSIDTEKIMKQLNALENKCRNPDEPLFKTWLQILETLDVLRRKIHSYPELR